MLNINITPGLQIEGGLVLSNSLDGAKCKIMIASFVTGQIVLDTRWAYGVGQGQSRWRLFRDATKRKQLVAHWWSFSGLACGRSTTASAASHRVTDVVDVTLGRDHRRCPDCRVALRKFLRPIV